MPEENKISLPIATSDDMKRRTRGASRKNIMVHVSKAALEVKWPLLANGLTKMSWPSEMVVFRDVKHM